MFRTVEERYPKLADSIGKSHHDTIEYIFERVSPVVYNTSLVKHDFREAKVDIMRSYVTAANYFSSGPVIWLCLLIFTVGLIFVGGLSVQTLYRVLAITAVDLLN